MNRLKAFRRWTIVLFLFQLTACGLTAEDWQAIGEGLAAASHQQGAMYSGGYQSDVGSYYPAGSVYDNSSNYYPYYSASESTSSIEYYIQGNSSSSSYQSEIESCRFSCGQVHDSCFNAANTVDNHSDGIAGDRIYYCRAELHSCEQRCAY